MDEFYSFGNGVLMFVIVLMCYITLGRDRPKRK